MDKYIIKFIDDEDKYFRNESKATLEEAIEYGKDYIDSCKRRGYEVKMVITKVIEEVVFPYSEGDSDAADARSSCSSQ